MKHLTRKDLHAMEHALNLAMEKGKQVIEDLKPEEAEANKGLVNIMNAQIERQQELKEKVMDINYDVEVEEIQIL